jgi:glycosyltransferase involved in cell wall biosynthesis
VSICDNKEISIGTKRQQMYELCKGKYAWQIDDDDWISENAIDLILDEIDKDMDCITFKEHCQFDNRANEMSNFSLKYKGEQIVFFW